jgi:hypothetical protein
LAPNARRSVTFRTNRYHTIIDEALQRSDSNEERWCISELLRIKGDIVRRRDHATAIDEAEDYLLRSLDWARRQDSLLWELPAAISFAELRRGQGRLVEARDLLIQSISGSRKASAAPTCEWPKTS